MQKDPNPNPSSVAHPFLDLLLVFVIFFLASTMASTKGNDGRAARRMLWQRLIVVLSCFVGVIVLLNMLGIGGNAVKNKNGNPSYLMRGAGRGKAQQQM